jgi:class 3 adenylate cyclase
MAGIAAPVFRARRRRYHLPIAAVLMTGFGTLMLAAVASVLVLGLISAGRNTFTLLADKANLALVDVEIRVRHQLDPALDLARFIAGMLERGDVGASDTARLTDLLTGALAAVPHVTGVAFITPALDTVRVARRDGRLEARTVNLTGRPDLPADLMEAADRTEPLWADPQWSKELKTTYLALYLPVRRDGHFLGQVVVAVSLADLSGFLSNLFVEQGVNAFVLYDDGHVLAHPSLAALRFDFADRKGEPPLPRIDEVDDPPLAALWAQGRGGEPVTRRTEVRQVQVAGANQMFLMRKMSTYGRQPWTLGIDMTADEVHAEVGRIYWTGITGLGILLVSVAVALWVGRRISRRIARLAEAAERVRAFEFRDLAELPDSRLRELSDAAAAFNAMVAGLRWFETYVPKALVLRLMRRRGGAPVLASEERWVTVMFTDIGGFSRLAGHMGPADTAALLNDHFSRLAACIEAEDGTVDKFIGDSLMAFWGAPEEQEDHAARALRAAHAIALAIAADNADREANELPRIRVRVGVHSGPVVVGNIGSASRINYTIIGDTVNVASRLEELGSQLQRGADTIVLVSGTTAGLAAGAAPLICLGPHPLRGRDEPTEIWRLADDQQTPHRQHEPGNGDSAFASFAVPPAGVS